MKKALAIILVLTLVLASAVTVFADENTATIESANDPNNYFERDVNIKIIPATGGATVYNVKFSWDSLDFTYKYRDSGTWNPENHTYTNTIEADWQGNTTATINVENHSNAPVKIISQFERVTIPDGAVFTEDTINNTKTLV